MLAPDEVHVWWLPLGRPPAETDWRILSAAEAARADRFILEGARDRYAVAHAGMRLILAGYLDADPAGLRFALEGEGKPLLADRPDLAFNLSHSGDLAVLAVAWHRTLGVDVERRRPVPDADRIAHRYFTLEERAGIMAATGDERSLAFLHCWTKKEAVIKAAGQGIVTALDQLAVPFGPAAGTRVEHAGLWDLYDLDPGPGYVAALALSPGPAAILAYALR